MYSIHYAQSRQQMLGKLATVYISAFTAYLVLHVSDIILMAASLRTQSSQTTVHLA